MLPNSLCILWSLPMEMLTCGLWHFVNQLRFCVLYVGFVSFGVTVANIFAIVFLALKHNTGQTIRRNLSCLVLLGGTALKHSMLPQVRLVMNNNKFHNDTLKIGKDGAPNSLMRCSTVWTIENLRGLTPNKWVGICNSMVLSRKPKKLVGNMLFYDDYGDIWSISL